MIRKINELQIISDQMSSADDSWNNSDTPEWAGEVSLFWMCPCSLPPANPSNNTTVQRVMLICAHCHICSLELDTQDSDGAWVEELVLYEKDTLQIIGFKHSP